MKKLFTYFLIVISLFATVDIASAATLCEESEAHKAYSKLTIEQKRKVIEPVYCKSNTTSNKKRLLKDTNLPSRFSSSDSGIISPSKNQGNYGTCWAFSAMATVSANSRKNGMQFINFSEKHLLYGLLSAAYQNANGKKDKFYVEDFDGGTFYYAPSYYYNHDGMMLENEYPYTSTLNPLSNASSYPTGNKYLSLKDFQIYSKGEYTACTTTDKNIIKRAIYDYGAVQGTMYMDQSLFKGNSKDYYISTTGDTDVADHAITIIGWDDTISKSNFNGAKNDGAWIIKNSWGSTWSNDGLFYISYDDHFICNDIGIYSGVTNKTFYNTYKTSKLLGMTTLSYQTSSVKVASTLTVGSDIDEETIKRVSFAVSDNQTYKVYLSKDKDKEDSTNWIKLGEGTSTYMGVKSIDIDPSKYNDVVINDDFMIIVEYSNQSKAIIPLMCDLMDDYNYATFVSNTNYVNVGSWDDLYGYPVMTGPSTITNIKCTPNIWVYTDDGVEADSVTLDKHEETLYLNGTKTVTLTATIAPDKVKNKTVVFSSSDDTIASVNQSGVVTAHKKGVATITVATSNGKTDTAVITVKDPKVLSIEFTNGDLNKTVGDSSFSVETKVVVQDNPEYTVTYSSMNESVATIDNTGHIEIKGSGTAVIKVTAGGQTAEFNLTVYAVIDSISFDKSEITLMKNDTTTLSVIFDPSDKIIDKTLSWKSDNPSIATVGSDGKVTGITAGETYIHATSVNDKKADIKVTVNKPAAQVSYTTHVQNIGWQDYVIGPEMAGTAHRSLRLEGIKIKLLDQDYSGDIVYRTHIETIGWETDYKMNDEMSGTSHRSLRLEAIQIKLTGEMKKHYDIYYRVHAQNFGWLGWAKNWEESGTAGYSYRLEGIEIKLVKKGEVFSEYGQTKAYNDAKEFVPPTKAGQYPEVEATDTDKYIEYTTHVQDVGWQDYVKGGEMAGTAHRSLRLEGIKIRLVNAPYSGDIEYRTHIQNLGWETEFKKNDDMSGTSHRSLRLEAIEIRLTGEMANHYDIYYSVHAQNFGWLGWAKNGERSGTARYSYRLEGIIIKLVPKDEEFYRPTKPKGFYQKY